MQTLGLGIAMGVLLRCLWWVCQEIDRAKTPGDRITGVTAILLLVAACWAVWEAVP